MGKEISCNRETKGTIIAQPKKKVRSLLGKFWRRRQQRCPSTVATLTPMRPLEPWTPPVRRRKSKICSDGLTVQCPGSGRQCRENDLSLIQKPSTLSGYAASDASCWRSGGAYVKRAGLGRDILATGTKGARMPWTLKVKMNSERFRNSTNWTKKPSSQRVPRRKTARSNQPEKWSFLR